MKRSKVSILLNVISWQGDQMKCINSYETNFLCNTNPISAEIVWQPCLCLSMDINDILYTTGKKYGIYFISATFCIFVGGAGYFCTWNTFLRADITFGGDN